MVPREEIIITRHGKAVARLVPNAAESGTSRDSTNSGPGERAHLPKFNWAEVKALRDEGRP